MRSGAARRALQADPSCGMVLGRARYRGWIVLSYGQLRAARILEQVFKGVPEHAGVAHYLSAMVAAKPD